MTNFERFLEKMGYDWQHDDLSYEINNLIEQYAKEKTKDAVEYQFVVHRVILFELKDGKYLDAAGNEITTEMLGRYEHQIDEDSGIVWLDDKIC